MVFFCFFQMLAQAQTAEQTVDRLSRVKFDWLVRQQMDSLLSLLDEGATYVHSNGWVQTRQDIVDDFRSGKLRYESVTVKESNVHVHDRTAVVVGLATFAGVMGGNAFRMDLRYTEVYVRLSQRWKLVSRHASRMP